MAQGLQASSACDTDPELLLRRVGHPRLLLVFRRDGIESQWARNLANKPVGVYISLVINAREVMILLNR